MTRYKCRRYGAYCSEACARAHAPESAPCVTPGCSGTWYATFPQPGHKAVCTACWRAMESQRASAFVKAKQAKGASS